MGKLVQHHKNILNPLLKQLKFVQLAKPTSRPKYNIYRKSNSSACSSCQKFNISKIFKMKCALKGKKFVPCFCSTKKNCYSRLNTRHKWHPHIAKGFSSPEHIDKHVEHYRKLIFVGVKVDQPKSPSAIYIFGLKAS